MSPVEMANTSVAALAAAIARCHGSEIALLGGESVLDDPAYFDLGICGPAREDDFANQPQNCGLFKTPSLRNVASRKVFFHNGVFRSLEDVVRFYADSNTDPQLYYPKGADGKPVLFNDMPARYRANVDKTDPPFDRKFGQKPALDEQDISDLVAFLKTLADR
jgi:cytochrome c peroxidase